MKRDIGFCLAVPLLAAALCTSACRSSFDIAKNLTPDAESIEPLELEVDGRRYVASGQYVYVRNSEQKNFVLIVCPESQQGRYLTALGYRLTVSTKQYDFLGKLRLDDNEWEAEPDTIYFVDDGKILFSKKHREIGGEFPNPKDFLKGENLKPVLETMIRDAGLPHPPKDE